MDINDSVNNSEYIIGNDQLVVEQITPADCPLETNINLSTNNITSTTEKNLFIVSPDIDKSYDLKPCFVELTRCDNIWKTLQLIRDLQEDVTSECSENSNDTEEHDDDEPTLSINDNESYSSSTQASNTTAPYIKYQPVLNNGNSALNFQFSVKSTRVLYQCHECGKQYSHRSTLREHSERIHNIILPIIRKRPENTTNDGKNVQLKVANDIQESNDINRDKISSVSIESHENSTNNLKEGGALLGNSFDTHSSEQARFIIENKIYICHYCNRQYKDKYYFNYHLKHSHGSSIIGIRSYNKRADNNDTVDTNQSRSSGSKQKNRRPQQNDQSGNLSVHRCNTCGKHFYDKARLGDHQRKVHGIYATKKMQRNRINNRCQSGDSNTNKNNILSNINGFYHEKEDRTIYPCQFCTKCYNDRQSWKTHLKRIHDIKFARFTKSSLSKGSKICQVCEKQYSSKRSLIAHLFTVHGQRLQHECDICGLRFQDSDSFIQHTFEMHKIMYIQRIFRRAKDKPHKCPVCSTHYGLKKNLDLHLIEAHGAKNLEKLKTVETSSSRIKTTAIRRPTVLPSKTLRKGLREKMRINYNEAGESRSIEQILLSETAGNNKNIDTLEKADNANSIICFLCQRRCTQIRRHFIEYHKIRHPESLIAQCKPSTSIVDSDNVTSGAISKNTKKSETEKSNSVINSPRQYRNIDPNRLFTRTISKNGRKIYKCKICPNYSSEQYETLRKHENQHRRQGGTPVRSTRGVDLNKQTYDSKKRKSTSTDNRDAQRQRLSSTIEHGRTTRATSKLKEEREFRCAVCDRLFRNAEILSSHKISCISYHGENSSINDTSDTRESSDRDSGIGISITIKKKNNSYEIVNREGNEDEKLLNPIEKGEDELKDDAVIGDNSSGAFAAIANDKKITFTESFPYSKLHRVLKIENAEDVDINIDLESTNDINTPSPQHENNQEVTSSGQRDDSAEISNFRITRAVPHQIPSLRRLCENILAKSKQKNKENPFKCHICPKAWPSRISLNLHMRIHSRSVQS